VQNARGAGMFQYLSRLCDGTSGHWGGNRGASIIRKRVVMPRLLARYLSALGLAVVMSPALAQDNWADVVAAADGQTVYFNAWGGAEPINDFIDWAAERVEDAYGVTVEHVKLSDTADAVARVISERSAGRDTDGAIDLIWINGSNFASMREQGLLYGPWVEQLPAWALMDPVANPLLTSDFTVPTDGLEAPWGMAQLVFFADLARVSDTPANAADLLDWAAVNPGRFAYPAVPDFSGTAFVKQVLAEVAPDPSVLQRRRRFGPIWMRCSPICGGRARPIRPPPRV